MRAAARQQPANLIRPYRAELIRKGMSRAEAEREMDRLGHLSFTRPEGAKVLWNKVYGGHDTIFVQTPNALLASAMLNRKPGRKPGKAPDFGMGQGRNTVFLAMQGLDVTGLDPSDESVRLAQANAANAGVTIRTVVADDQPFDLGVAQWDLIVMTYIRSPTVSDAERIRCALSPGGDHTSRTWTPSRTGIPPKKFASRAWWRRSHRSNISS